MNGASRLRQDQRGGAGEFAGGSQPASSGRENHRARDCRAQPHARRQAARIVQDQPLRLPMGGLRHRRQRRRSRFAGRLFGGLFAGRSGEAPGENAWAWKPEGAAMDKPSDPFAPLTEDEIERAGQDGQAAERAGEVKTDLPAGRRRTGRASGGAALGRAPNASGAMRRRTAKPPSTPRAWNKQDGKKTSGRSLGSTAKAGRSRHGRTIARSTGCLKSPPNRKRRSSFARAKRRRTRRRAIFPQQHCHHVQRRRRRSGKNRLVAACRTARLDLARQ